MGMLQLPGPIVQRGRAIGTDQAQHPSQLYGMGLDVSDIEN